MDSTIHKFWKYVSENIGSLNVMDLDVNIPIIQQYKDRPIEEYSLKLNSSGIYYLNMSNKFAEISKEITFTLTLNAVQFEYNIPRLNWKIAASLGLSEEEVANKEKSFLRYWIVISSRGNKAQYPLVESIYNIAKQYTFPE